MACIAAATVVVAVHLAAQMETSVSRCLCQSHANELLASVAPHPSLVGVLHRPRLAEAVAEVT